MDAITTNRPPLDRREFRVALEARRRELIGDVQRRVARIRDGSTPAGKELDEADAQDLDAALVDLATVTLRRIDEAIDRLDAGIYGLCTRCAEPISEARLLALPFALCCRDCETARERQLMHTEEPARTKAWTRALTDGDLALREDR
jgi:DnaK suppressor protein